MMIESRTIWPETLKNAISEEAARWCVEKYKDDLRAIVLTGSLARDEATFVEEGNRWRLLGDAEFLLVFHERAGLPSAAQLDPLRRRIEEALLRGDLVCRISLNSVQPTYFRKLKPHIFAYELRACGQVILGDRRILSLIPSFSPSDIPLEDAWRTLCNRMVELIEVAHELEEGQAGLRVKAHYRLVKLYLDMATSYLVFAGGYEPTYRGRAERLEELAERSRGDTPFPLGDFAERVRSCTRGKLLGRDPRGPSTPCGGTWEEAFTYAQQLWRWELARLTGMSGSPHDRALLEQWMQHQSFQDRFRGWLFVLRRRGWHRSWRDWPRWGRHAWRASPRYWVYAAASELFFRLPLLVRSEKQDRSGLNWDELRCLLPVARNGGSPNEESTWQQLASDIVWNYHEFLVETRS